MKVALVYDRINKWGGAERVLLALHELFPDAPLYTSVYNPKKAPWASIFNVKTSFLQNFPGVLSSHEIYALFMPLAFESFTFDEYDLVISITSEAVKGIITKPKTLHICYCLTPTRYLWSGYDQYFANPTLRFLSKPAISYLRSWDLIASQRPDKYIAISKEVKGRIKKYYGRDSEVVYPPVAIQSSEFRVQNSNENSKYQILNTKYFLVVSRLVPYKRVDIAIKACNRLKLPLVVVGSGSEENTLRGMCGPTVKMLSNLTDKELVEYYKGCRALIFPTLDDFGLTVLEAQSFGKPVIAYRGGGALETIIEEKTGQFFNQQTIDALEKVLIKFQDKAFNPKDSIEQAEKFNKEKFKKSFVTLVSHYLETKKI